MDDDNILLDYLYARSSRSTPNTDSKIATTHAQSSIFREIIDIISTANHICVSRTDITQRHVTQRHQGTYSGTNQVADFGT